MATGPGEIDHYEDLCNDTDLSLACRIRQSQSCRGGAKCNAGVTVIDAGQRFAFGNLVSRHADSHILTTALVSRFGAFGS